jgi:imidazolonepropionase
MNERTPADLVIRSAAQLLTCQGDAADLIGLIPDGWVAIGGKRIIAVGSASDVSQQVDLSRAKVIDATGRVVMPGFVDCHTHVVFGGSRVDEYAAKLTGIDLEALRRAGKPVGITGTVGATRALSVDELVEQTVPRLAEMLAAGTTTVESKSGYGLTLESELALLRANKQLDSLQPIDIVSTFLGAHAIPPDVPREHFIASVIEEMTPQVAEEGLAEFTDVFCESGYIWNDEAEAILRAGLAHGLKPKIHIDQYEYTGAADFTARLRCTSADHLNYTKPEEMRTLAAAGVVGVAMPGLEFSVAHPRPVDCRAIIESSMTLALATDICPGCWMPSMQLVINLACRLHHISPAEAIRAATLGAALAIDRGDEIGSLEPGKLADLLILDVSQHEDLAYRLGRNAVETVIKRGEIVVERKAGR